MAITTTSCLKLPPPTPSSNSIAKKPQLSWFRNEKLRKQCVVSMACMLIGLEMGNFVSNEEIAVGKEMQIVVVESNDGKQRWSDKRKCPPWHLNSLETIVPENLPRPSARRRSESIRNSSIAPPTTQLMLKTTPFNTCFSV